MCLGKDILRVAKAKGIDPYITPFTPKDLGIKASDYGSFSDWCAAGHTKSAKYNRRVCLKVATKHLRSGRPHKYVLLPQSQWKC